VVARPSALSRPASAARRQRKYLGSTEIRRSASHLRASRRVRLVLLSTCTLGGSARSSRSSHPCASTGCHPVRCRQSGPAEQDDAGTPRGTSASLRSGRPSTHGTPGSLPDRATADSSRTSTAKAERFGVGELTPDGQPTRRCGWSAVPGGRPRGCASWAGPVMNLRSFSALQGGSVWRVGRHPLGCVRFGPGVVFRERVGPRHARPQERAAAWLWSRASARLSLQPPMPGPKKPHPRGRTPAQRRRDLLGRAKGSRS